MDPLPVSYDAWKTAAPKDKEHAKDCPQHPDNLESCPPGCKGCELDVVVCEHCANHVSDECTCPTPEENRQHAGEERAEKDR